MATDELEITVRPEGFEEISGLIASLSDVAEAATGVVTEWERESTHEEGLEDKITNLKNYLVALNDFVDAHIDD